MATDLGLIDQHGVREKLNQLPGRPTDFIVVGGAALTLHGLRTARNLNLLVGRGLWDSVVYRPGWTTRNWGAPASTVQVLVNDGLGIEMYRDLTIAGCPLTYEIASRQCDTIMGMRVVKMSALARWKRARGRSQDQADANLIEQWRLG